MLTTIHCIFDNNTLPASQRYGIVTIIPKAGKDNTLIQNWRPLTLLNTLYKLISSILSFRLKHVLSRILGLHQRAYIPGRFIGEVTRNIYNAFSFAKQQNNPGLAVMVDFEKAFDLVSFDFINLTLKVFGFCPVFTKWVNILLGRGQDFKAEVADKVTQLLATCLSSVLRSWSF